MANEIAKTRTTKKNEHTHEEKLRAAYALNMCTVSVSQIVDYNDSYILEQEYDAILNNLNLKEMPKDEALLRIITELLNTITFFRIQEIKKQQIEKKYNQRIKNAIWSAVPSLSVVVSGNPVAIAMSLATQIGTGYMNYRKEKNSAKADKEDADIELEITAIEQLNSLKRELFTTAWRLADEYDFNDEWRITEKQIKQYNKILMDSDDLRKYARLESIADRFVAYPPFWYFYGHTANYIAEMAKNRLGQNTQDSDEDILAYCKDQAVVKQYSYLAKEHFEHYYKLCENNILREDQLTASFALEYLDLLWDDEERDIEKLGKLIRLAETMAPTSFDVLQLCVISYLKIGETDEAARILKILVNEDYNTSANAKLLSRIYVSKYLNGNKKDAEKAMTDYYILSETSDSVYLFPMPLKKPSNTALEDRKLEDEFIEEQKYLLQKEYRVTINEFIKAGIVKYNKLWPVPNTARKVDDRYFDYTLEARKRRSDDVKKALDGDDKSGYIAALSDSSFRVHYLDMLNDVLRSLDELSIFRYYEDKDYLVRKIRKQIINSRNEFKQLQNKMEDGTFTFEDYSRLQKSLSFQKLTEEFFGELKTVLMDRIDNADDIATEQEESPMKYLENAELELIEFCNNHNLPDPDEFRKNNNGIKELPDCNYYFDYSILGDDIDGEVNRKKQRKEMHTIVKKYASSILLSDVGETAILLPDTSEFEVYFKNVMLGGAGLKTNVLAIIDDKTKRDRDILLTYNGVIVVKKNKIQPVVPYKEVFYHKAGNKDELFIDWPDTYSNKNVNLAELYNLIEKISDTRELQ